MFFKLMISPLLPHSLLFSYTPNGPTQFYNLGTFSRILLTLRQMQIIVLAMRYLQALPGSSAEIKYSFTLLLIVIIKVA